MNPGYYEPRLERTNYASSMEFVITEFDCTLNFFKYLYLLVEEIIVDWNDSHCLKESQNKDDYNGNVESPFRENQLVSFPQPRTPPAFHVKESDVNISNIQCEWGSWQVRHLTQIRQMSQVRLVTNELSQTNWISESRLKTKNYFLMEFDCLNMYFYLKVLPRLH